MLQRVTFEHEIGLLRQPSSGLPALERDTPDAPRTAPAIKHLSLLPHRVEKDRKDVELKLALPGETPTLPNPGFYDGPDKYKIAANLQACLDSVMKGSEFEHIHVALADLTGSKLAAPDFAGHKHGTQVFVASVAKIAVMLAAFQLRHDLRFAARTRKLPDVADLFSKVRADWAATQSDPGGKSIPLGGKLQLRGSVVLAGGAKIPVHLTRTDKKKPPDASKAPQLEEMFTPTLKGLSVEFRKSGEPKDELRRLVRGYNLSDAKDAVEDADRKLKSAQQDLRRASTTAGKSGALGRVNEAKIAKQNARKALKAAEKKKSGFEEKIRALEFRERLGIAIGGLVPASNMVMETVVGDVGFHHIASTLIQTGLFDPVRKGGLWLGADYRKTIWSDSGSVAWHPQSATAASLVSFMTLLAQDSLVSKEASTEMKEMMKKPSALFPGTDSWFKDALASRNPSLVLSKVGFARRNKADPTIADEVAYIERDVEADVEDSDGNKKRTRIKLRYAVAALRARKTSHLASLVRELDNCVLANNGVGVATGMRIKSKGS